MDSQVETQERLVNCLGAPWPEDLSPAFLDLAAELTKRNYSGAAVQKILSGNLLRVLRNVLPDN
jgi:microsomal dipeptidase-like Zn-dependent dipeptidase